MRETGEWGRDEGCWGVGWRGRNNKAQVDMGRCGECQAHSASLHCWQFRAYIFLHCLVRFSQLIKKELFLSSPPRGGEGCLHTHTWRSEVNGIVNGIFLYFSLYYCFWRSCILQSLELTDVEREAVLQASESLVCAFPEEGF